MLDPSQLYFPDADAPEIQPLARAFVRVMFAHGRLEREIGELENVVTSDAGYAEGRRPQSARNRPKAIRDLISNHLGAIPELEPVVTLMHRAIPLCDRRNLLAHGDWWCFDPTSETITVARLTIRPGENRHEDFSTWQIADLASAFEDVEVELYQLRRTIEKRTRGAR
jgi:hypothetical protein